MDYKDISQEHLDAHIDKIVETCESIPLDKVVILTGGNALGKSLIRKQLSFYVSAEKGTKPESSVCSTSMQVRTENRPEFGALSNCMHDLPWCSTSESTIHLLKGLLKDTEQRYIVIDELEIGMGREVQVGTCMMLNKMLPELLKKNFGVLIITHSETVVKNINHDVFINIEGMTEQEWLNRDIIPVDPDDLSTWATKLFCAVRDRQQGKKKKD